MEAMFSEEAMQGPSIFNCKACKRSLFTSVNVVSVIEDGILVKNKLNLAQCSLDWDWKQKGKVCCP